MSEKAVNYTVEQTAKMVEMYKAGAGVEVIAETMGRTVRSVIAKLSREGVYKAKSAEKAGKRVTKADLVSVVEKELNLTEGTLESLAKGSHEALEALANAVRFETAE